MTTNMKKVIDKLSGGADQGDQGDPIGQPVLKLSGRDAASIELARLAITHAERLLGGRVITWESMAGTKDNPVKPWLPVEAGERDNPDYGRYLLSGQFAKDWNQGDPNPQPRYFAEYSNNSNNVTQLWEEIRLRSGIVLLEVSVPFDPALLDAYGTPPYAVGVVLKERVEKAMRFLDRVNLFSQKMGMGTAIRWQSFGGMEGAKRIHRGFLISYGRYYELR